MSAYLGTLGRLVPIYSNPTMDVSGEGPYTFTKTLEGRVKAQARPASRRTWELSARAASPTEVGVLTGFASGEWGIGPFVWIAPDAPSINLLTPEASTCGPAAAYSRSTTVGGPMALGDGTFAGRSLVSADVTETSYVSNTRAPVIPGQVVTGSMWVLGAGAKVRLHWYGADLSPLGAVQVSPESGAAGEPRRLHVTAIPPAGAVGCLLSTVGAIQSARPAITWTETPFPWGGGQGCPKAVVSSTSRVALAASSRDPARNYSDMSFTITEVGN